MILSWVISTLWGCTVVLSFLFQCRNPALKQFSASRKMPQVYLSLLFITYFLPTGPTTDSFWVGGCENLISGCQIAIPNCSRKKGGLYRWKSKVGYTVSRFDYFGGWLYSYTTINGWQMVAAMANIRIPDITVGRMAHVTWPWPHSINWGYAKHFQSQESYMVAYPIYPH